MASLKVFFCSLLTNYARVMRRTGIESVGAVFQCDVKHTPIRVVVMNVWEEMNAHAHVHT